MPRLDNPLRKGPSVKGQPTAAFLYHNTTGVVSDIETIATKVILLRAEQIVDAAPVPDLITKYSSVQGLEKVYFVVFGDEGEK